MNLQLILDLVTKNRFGEAFKVFKTFFVEVEDIKKEMILLEGRYNKLKDQERMNIIRPDDLNREEGLIRKSILDTFAKTESLIISDSNGSSSSESKLTDKSQLVLKIVEDEMNKKGYKIIDEIYSSQSSIYFKAEKLSFVQKDFYVIQVLNRYELHNPLSGYNQKYLDFFSPSPHPFVDLIDFHPEYPSYIIRKYAKGVDLNSLVQSGIKLSMLKAFDTIISISNGLKELHDVQIFYNNLTPDKIILDSGWDLHLLPLNIFNNNDNIVTWKKLNDGIKFMSPEQLALSSNKVEQEKLTIVSNQFSIALIMFFILTGESLFDGKGLPSLYEDRINQEVTRLQLKNFYTSIYKNLLQLGIKEEKATELLSEFKIIFKKLIQNKPLDRYQIFDDFVADIEFLKLRIEREKRSSEKKNFNYVAHSFYRSIKLNDNLIEEFYEEMMASSSKKSMENTSKRNIRLQYSLDYLFMSVSSFDNQEYLEEVLSCLVKNLHFDFTIEDYDVFFKLLKNSIAKNDSDWNDKIEESWDDFIGSILDAIDTILNPVVNF